MDPPKTPGEYLRWSMPQKIIMHDGSQRDEPHRYRCYAVQECGCHCTILCDYHLDEEVSRLTPKAPAKRNSHLKAEEGVEYAFTLTMPPDMTPVKPLTEVAKSIMVHGLTNKPYEKASHYAYVLEHTERGTPHIHGVYKTPSGRRISGKYFKRYWPLWDETVKLGHGHKGGYHQKARHSESYAAYLEKEGVVQKGADLTDAKDSVEKIEHI